MASNARKGEPGTEQKMFSNVRNHWFKVATKNHKSGTRRIGCKEYGNNEVKVITTLGAIKVYCARNKMFW